MMLHLFIENKKGLFIENICKLFFLKFIYYIILKGDIYGEGL